MGKLQDFEMGYKNVTETQFKKTNLEIVSVNYWHPFWFLTWNPIKIITENTVALTIDFVGFFCGIVGWDKLIKKKVFKEKRMNLKSWK